MRPQQSRLAYACAATVVKRALRHCMVSASLKRLHSIATLAMIASAHLPFSPLACLVALVLALGLATVGCGVLTVATV